MNFKNWIMNEIRFKGFRRAFDVQYPEMPRYVRNQFYQNRLSQDLNRAVQNTPSMGNSPTIDYVPGNQQLSSGNPNLSPSQIFKGQNYLQNVQWPKKPSVIMVSPLDFDEGTLRLFSIWKFGFNPQNKAIRDDEARFDKQRELLTKTQTGDNEPVIIIKEPNGKLKLIEGYHRTMLYLLSPQNPAIGAPEDQIRDLKQGGKNIDFSIWKKVPIKAFVGQRVNAVPQPLA